MIIKEYDIEPKQNTLLADHHRKIMMDILKNISIEMHDNFSYVRPDVVVGFDILNLLDMNFTFGKVMNFSKLDAPVGFLSGCKVYLDIRLKNNEVVIGDYLEIHSSIVREERKQKLLKINES